ncbi:MAG: RICIN domain-containing protein [Fibrobacterales bacterium]
MKAFKHLVIALGLTATIAQAKYTITDVTYPTTAGSKILFSVENGSAYIGAAWAYGERQELFITDGIEATQITENTLMDRFAGVENGRYAYHVPNEPGVHIYNGTETNNVAPEASLGWEGLSFSNGQVVFSMWDGNDSEVYFYNGSELVQITDNDIRDNNPSIHNGHIVWVGGELGIHEVYSWKDGIITQIPSGIGAMDPIVENDIIVWGEYIPGSDREVFMHSNGVTTNISNSPQSDDEFAISNGQVVWKSRYDFGGHPPYNFNHYEVVLFDGTNTTSISSHDETVKDIRIDNGNIVYLSKQISGGNFDVYHYNGAVINQVTNTESNEGYPVINGSYIGWTQLTVDGDLVKIAEITGWDPSERFFLTARHSGKALDGAGGDNGSNIQQWDLHGGLNQQWTITASTFGHAITNVASGKVLDVAEWSKENGGNAHQWDWVNGLNQQWILTQIENGSYIIMNVLSGKVLDVSEYAYWNGASIHQWEYVGEANQQWNITKVSE